MDKDLGNAKARELGICLAVENGKTCGRGLRDGQCRRHKGDVYKAAK